MNSIQSLLLLALVSAKYVQGQTPPVIPTTWIADVQETSSGTFPGAPHGTKAFTEYHDYANKRRRVDFTDQGYTKIYRYDVKSFDHNPFPASKGYKMRLDSAGKPSDLNCCWLWLVDEDGNDEKMYELELPKNAKDAGKTPSGLEKWTSNGYFPIKTSGSYYFDANNTLIQFNSFASVLGKGTIIGNNTYANWIVGPIDNSTFAVPTSDPTFGKCKQCGVDPMCPMQECMS